MNTAKIETLIQQALDHRQAGRENEAIQTLREVLTAEKNHPDALVILGQMAHENQSYDVARDLYLKSLKTDPEQFHVWSLYGKVLFDLGQPEEAEKALRKALEIRPGFGQAYKQLAQLALSRGDNEQAIAYARKALEINPKLTNAYFSLARAKAIPPDDPLVGQILDLIKEFEDQPENLSQLHFALSFIYERGDDKKTFFAHVKKANECMYKPAIKSQSELESRFENIRKIMTPDFLKQKVDEAEKVFTPIFVVGMPRSGTTLLDQIFATHSECFGADELLYFPKYLHKVATGGMGKMDAGGYPNLNLEEKTQVAKFYQGRVRMLAPDAKFVSDKLPWNYQHIGMIATVLPWAKIIHIHRDPMDCGWSVYRNPLQKGVWFSHDMEGYAWYRKRYQDLMDFWAETIPERFIDVAYEDLVSNPEKEIKRILEYCGLSWEDDLLNFHKTKREVRTMSAAQVNKPIHRSSVGSSKAFAAELKPMEDALKKYGVI